MRNKIGVLDLQGGVLEHLTHLEALGLKPVAVKKAEQLDDLAGIIFPGGESTCMIRLLRIFEMEQPIKEAFADGMKIWGTCAGAILIANEVVGEKPNLQLMNISVDRNAFGPQIDSFHETAVIPAISGEPLELTFIRAPQITAVGEDVKVLHTTNGIVTAAETKDCLATSFHPELSGSTAFHKYFAKKCGLSVKESDAKISEKAWMHRGR